MAKRYKEPRTTITDLNRTTGLIIIVVLRIPMIATNHKATDRGSIILFKIVITNDQIQIIITTDIASGREEEALMTELEQDTEITKSSVEVVVQEEKRILQ